MTQTTQPLADKFGAITLFVRDLQKSRDHYAQFLQTAPVFEDAESTVYQVGSTYVNLLAHTAVPELVAPLEMAPTGLRAVYTLPVSDVDQAVEALAAIGLSPVSAPVDRPWGIRTANFADPDGYVWELSCDL